MKLEWVRGVVARLRDMRLALTLGLLVLLTVGGLAWAFRDFIRSPRALYREAQCASPRRAAVLYGRLARRMPQIEEYARLWAAKVAMPNLAAMRMLQAVAVLRPQSPAAFQAHVAMARHYASIEAPEAEDAYRAALALDDSVPLRLELARYLEEQGDHNGAYGQYQHILSQQPDAFVDMRRTGRDPLAVAEDLKDAYYYTDVLETLRGVDDPEALPLRAQALAGLGHHQEAEEAYKARLEDSPGDTVAQMGRALALGRLGRSDEALAIYQTIDTLDSRLSQAELLEEEEPDRALALYLDSPYPVSWWSATTILENQGRLTETLPLYARVAAIDNYLADDAAYRLHVLATKLGDEKRQEQAKNLLDELGLNWLALRAAGSRFTLNVAPPIEAAGGDILAKVSALESIGRDDLANLELVLAARFRRAPELDLAMAEALVSRGHVAEAQAIAQAYIEDRPRAPLAFWRLSYPRPYLEEVVAAAAEFDVNPLLIWAIMRRESCFDPEAYGYAGERGLMQIMPSTQDWIAERLGEDISPSDGFSPEINVRMAAWFVRFLLDYFDEDPELVIPAYNAGAGSVDNWQADPLVSDRDDFLRWIWYGSTREYLEKVSLDYRVYQALYEGEMAAD